MPGQSEDRAARGHLNGCDAPAEQHDEPVTVAGAKQAGVLGERRDDMLGDLVRVGRAGFLVPDVQLIAADEPDAKGTAWRSVPAVSLKPGDAAMLMTAFPRHFTEGMDGYDFAPEKRYFDMQRAQVAVYGVRWPDVPVRR